MNTSSENSPNDTFRESLKEEAPDARITTRLLFRLLPLQILLSAITAINGIVSSLFASNDVGELAMSAIALYGPVNMLITAICFLLVSGATVLYGKYLGRNQEENLPGLFSLDLALSAIVSVIFVGVLVLLPLLGRSGFPVRDAAVRPVFNQYLLGQAIGIFPLVLGNQLSAFLSLENQIRRTTIATLVLIAANIVLNLLFVRLLHWQAFGLALASSMSLWIFFAVEAQYFLTGKTPLRFSVREISWGECGSIIKIGFSGAATYGYQTLRGLVVNALITLYVGSAGLSAFAASDSILRFFWAIPAGMVAVSRMLISVSIGEEDRRKLEDVMRNMFYRFVPLMGAVSLLIILMAAPFTRLFYRDPASQVYMMTVWGFRILPLCMPLSVICMHFICYGQASNKQALVHILSILDGLVCVAGFSALLVPAIGMNGVYIANVLNGVVTTLIIILYAVLKNHRFPRTMGELMVIPADFGVPACDRLDITVENMEEVMTISRAVQTFCREKGIDERRSVLAALALEEMAGNVAEHGFQKDRKKHTADIRVVYKNQGILLRISDDCVPFDPSERRALLDSASPEKNVGIRMVYEMAEDVQYQNILGLNVLTIRL